YVPRCHSERAAHRARAGRERARSRPAHCGAAWPARRVDHTYRRATGLRPTVADGTVQRAIPRREANRAVRSAVEITGYDPLRLLSLRTLIVLSTEPCRS